MDEKAQRPPAKPAILPPPFEWIEIPAGEVKLEEQIASWRKAGTYSVESFYIAKYPITNAQFAAFKDAGGYSNKSYWTQAGWHPPTTRKESSHWQNPKWNGSEQPVVRISWHEAYAFTQWLSEITGEQISLPTEQQWQRAAQGDDGRIYPWGNTWDRTLCNNSVDNIGIGKTTPVQQYEGKGDSPFGVVDMSGNVHEWCLTGYYYGSNSPEGTDDRVLRGGAWDGRDPNQFHVTTNGSDHPDHSEYDAGFRVVLG